MQTAYAPVAGIVAALDHAARFEAVDQPAHRDRLDLADGRELVLRHARLAVQAGENDPLGARHAVGARRLVDAGAHQPCDVVKHDQNITVEGRIHVVSHPGCGLI